MEDYVRRFGGFSGHDGPDLGYLDRVFVEADGAELALVSYRDQCSLLRWRTDSHPEVIASGSRTACEAAWAITVP